MNYTERRTQQGIAMSVKDRYNKIMQFLKLIPEGCDLDQDKVANYNAENIIAIEQEMIVDDATRMRLSVLRIEES